MRRDRTAAPSERRFTRPASSIRSTVRKSARPRAMTTSGSGPTRSVHCGGTDHMVTPSSCSKTRSPYRLYRLPTQGSCRPNSGWNGCVTRTNCNDRLEESAVSVEVQATGKGPLHVAVYEGGLGHADPGATIDALGRARVEGTTADVGPDTGGIRRALRRHDSTQLGREADKPRTCRSRPISCPTTPPS